MPIQNANQEEQLPSGETEIIHLHPSRWLGLRMYFIAALLIVLSVLLEFDYLPIAIPATYNIALIALPVLALLLVIYVEIAIRMNSFTLTNHGIIDHEGLFSKNEMSVEWSAVSSANIRQNVIERLLDIGDIYIKSTGGNDAPEIDMRKVAHVNKVKSIIDRLISSH
jgi:uncharacterized membrane protein YdbT with pleckstrin-like domain